MNPSSPGPAPRSSGPRRTRPTFEALESRTVPSVPAGTAWTPFGESPEPSIIITFLPKGAVNIFNTGVGPYDGIEDTYIGVVNLSGKPIPKFNISGPSSSGFSEGIFDLDGDGIQTYGSPAPAGGGGTGYEGPDNFFSNISDDGLVARGTINFIGGLANKQQTYFSLEGPPTDVQVGVDLKLSLDDTHIVPVKATDLHLNHFYGTESVRLPVTIENVGAENAKGKVSVEVFLSTTTDISGSVTGDKAIATLTPTINLDPGSAKALNADVDIGSGVAAKLTEG